jgi:hypothetical protein
MDFPYKESVNWALTTVLGGVVAMTAGFVRKVNKQEQRLDKIETLLVERDRALNARLDTIDDSVKRVDESLSGLTTYLLNQRRP